MKKVTITDVANHAQVSVTTVSMVLSQKGRISPETIDKVNLAVTELGYVKNRTAANLRSNHSEIIGLILNDISDPFYAQVAAGLCEESEKQGYMVFLSQCSDENQFDQAFRTMSNQGVGGIAFCPKSETQFIDIDALNQHTLPKVCISRASIHHSLDNVCPDNANAAKIATQYLIQQGHKRIAYIGGFASSLRRAERVGGYCSTLMQYGLPFHPEWVIECERGQLPAAKTVEQLLKRHPQISGILCHYDSTCFGVIHGLMKQGRTLGQDTIFGKQMSVIGFDVIRKIDKMIPIITSINCNAKEIGRQAAQRLIEQIHCPDPTPRKTIVPAMIMDTQQSDLSDLVI